MAKKKGFFAHPSAFVEKGAIVGKRTKIWHNAQLRSGCVVGENCIIGKNAYIDSDVKICNRAKVQNNSIIYNADIADDVFIGPAVCFTNDLRPRAFIWDEKRKAPRTVIQKGASIGANATLLAGITVGEYAMVGAGAVVTKSVPVHGLVLGNPARLVAYVCECGEKLSMWEKDGCFFCPECEKQITIKEQSIESEEK